MNLRKQLPHALAGLAVMFSFSCSKNNKTDNPQPAAPANTVQLATNATFGNIMTDAKGKTLYFFAIDANGSSGCTGGCSVVWTTFYQDPATLTLDKGLDVKDFGTITRTDGSKQTTYKGWPLYYYQNDAKAGDTNGDKVGQTWFVAKPDYTVMVANSQLIGNDNVKYTSDLKAGTGVTQYIVTDRGQTLYSFSHDKANKNNFTAADFSNNKIWPIDTIAAVQNVPSILDKTQFSTIAVFGKTQLIYKGWPLYYFGADGSVRGNNKGVSVPTPGTWPYANATSPAAPAN